MESAIIWGIIIAIVLVIRHNIRKYYECIPIDKKYKGKCDKCGSEKLTIISKISSSFANVRCENCNYEFVGQIGELPEVEEDYSKPCYNCGNYKMYVYVQDGNKYGICTKCYQQKVLKTHANPKINKTIDSKMPSDLGKTTAGKTLSTYSKMSKTKTGIIIIVIVCFILWLVGSCNSSTSHYRNGREVRCWYCSKVIINTEGRAIHATHSFGNTYICDYCGKSNVVK